MDKRVLGKYQLTEKIGSGGMGEVFRAELSGYARPVAVKVLHWNMAGEEGMVSRFRNEAKTIRKLDHPNIVRFLDGPLEKEGLWYFVMEFAEGEGLDEILKRRGKLPLDQIVRIAAQTCAAMQHAHDKEVVHRDLKPSNIKVGINDVVKIMDFGIAKVMHSSVLTSMHTLKGTVEYMSPEQCRESVSEEKESDIYSLGIILYQMTTGEVPFSSKYWYSVLRQHLEEKPRNPRELNPHIPDELDACIMKCLEKDPSQRFASMAELSEALTESVSKVRADDAALGCNQVIGERYRLDERLSHKGQCTIYRGVDRTTGETVAVKLLPWYLSDNAEYRERLKREAYTLEELTHHHIVKFRSKLITEDNIYLIIEWIEGVTLSELIETQAPLPPAQARHILRQICSALTYLHNREIVHRDIKGSNIMVGSNDRVTLLDFGVVRLPDSTVTAMGQVIGTPKYMSPEQCRGERVDVRSDVYSLGLLVFEMLTGRFPYNVSTIEGYIEAHGRKEPLQCTKANRDLPRALEKWFARVLAKAREKRFSSVLEMLEGFDEACRFGKYRTPADMLQNTLREKYQITQLTSDTSRWSFRGKDLETKNDVIIKGVAFVGDYSEDTITTLHDSAAKLVRKLPRGCPQTDDILEENGRLFVVRSFMEGGTSREIVRQKGRLSLEEAAQMVIPLCAAVKDAHQHGVYGLHLHPSHALFPPNAPDEEPVLIGLETACIKHDLRRLCSDKGLHEVEFLESRETDTTIPPGKARRTDTRALWLLFDELVTGTNYPDNAYTDLDVRVSTPAPSDLPDEARLLWAETLRRGKRPEFAEPDELLAFLNDLVARSQIVEIEEEPEPELPVEEAASTQVRVVLPDVATETAIIRPDETVAAIPRPMIPEEVVPEPERARPDREAFKHWKKIVVAACSLAVVLMVGTLIRWLVTREPPPLPELAITAVNVPETIVEGTEGQIEIEASYKSRQLRYEMVCDDPSVTIEGDGPVFVVRPSYNTVSAAQRTKEIQIEARVSDRAAEGSVRSESRYITVEHVPSIAIAGTTPPAGEGPVSNWVGEEVQLAVDAQVKAGSPAYRWFVEGEEQQGAASRSFAYRLSEEDLGQDRSVRVEVTNGMDTDYPTPEWIVRGLMPVEVNVAPGNVSGPQRVQQPISFRVVSAKNCSGTGEGLKYAWRVNGKVQQGADSTFRLVPEEPGEYTVDLAVQDTSIGPQFARDDRASWDHRWGPFPVEAGGEIWDLAATPTWDERRVVEEGKSLKFQARLYDKKEPERKVEARYSWYVGDVGDEQLESQPVSGDTFEYKPGYKVVTGDGSRTKKIVRVLAVPADGPADAKPVEGEWDVTVLDGPDIGWTKVDPPEGKITLAVGRSQTFKATAEDKRDPDREMRYRWFVAGKQVPARALEDDGQTHRYSHQKENVGKEMRVEATPENPPGDARRLVAKWTLGAVPPPEFVSRKPDPNTEIALKKGDKVTFEVQARDSIGRELKYDWQVAPGDEMKNLAVAGGSCTYTSPGAGATGREVTVTVGIAGDDGKRMAEPEPVSWKLKLVALTSRIAWREREPDPAKSLVLIEGEEFEFKARAADEDDASRAIGYSWQRIVDGRTQNLPETGATLAYKATSVGTRERETTLKVGIAGENGELMAEPPPIMWRLTEVPSTDIEAAIKAYLDAYVKELGSRARYLRYDADGVTIDERVSDNRWRVSFTRLAYRTGDAAPYEKRARSAELMRRAANDWELTDERAVQ